MVKYEDFVNDKTLNIFCDASILELGKDNYSGCYGAMAMCKDRLYDQEYFICTNTTNNNSEIKAIRTGVQMASIFKDKFENINIFSDSEISILGIRDRIFNWYLCDGKFYGYNYNPIKSQSVYVEIVTMILNNDITLGMYHQKGHVNTKYTDDINKAIKVFAASNGLRDSIDTSLIKYISDYNNKIDGLTRLVLRTRVEQAMLPQLGDAIKFNPTPYLVSRLPDYKDHITNFKKESSNG